MTYLRRPNQRRFTDGLSAHPRGDLPSKDVKAFVLVAVGMARWELPLRVGASIGTNLTRDGYQRLSSGPSKCWLTPFRSLPWLGRNFETWAFQILLALKQRAGRLSALLAAERVRINVRPPDAQCEVPDVRHEPV